MFFCFKATSKTCEVNMLGFLDTLDKKFNSFDDSIAKSLHSTFEELLCTAITMRVDGMNSTSGFIRELHNHRQSVPKFYL